MKDTPSIEVVVSTLAWILVLRNKSSIDITAEIGAEKIEMELRLKDPTQLPTLINAMSGKP